MGMEEVVYQKHLLFTRTVFICTKLFLLMGYFVPGSIYYLVNNIYDCIL